MIKKKIKIFSNNSFNILSFYDKDHGPRDGSDLKAWVIDNLKSNHIKHLHSDVDKIDNKIDKITSWIIYGLGSFGIVLLGQLLYILTK